MVAPGKICIVDILLRPLREFRYQFANETWFVCEVRFSEKIIKMNIESEGPKHLFARSSGLLRRSVGKWGVKIGQGEYSVLKT